MAKKPTRVWGLWDNDYEEWLTDGVCIRTFATRVKARLFAAEDISTRLRVVNLIPQEPKR